MAFEWKNGKEANEATAIDAFQWKYFLRQVLIASGAWSAYFSIGIVLGAPTVIIPQLRKNANETGPVSDEMASWLSSVVIYASIPWIFILAYMAHMIGRKKTTIFVMLCNIVSYALFFFSVTPLHILITEITFGVTQGSLMTTTIICIAEYTSPQYRGAFLCIKSATIFWGIWVANAIGTFTVWHYIPMFGMFASLYGFSVFFWPESPHWLAGKKRFEECKVAHRWLKGTGENSERELEGLIKSFSADVVAPFVNFKSLKKKDFYVPLLISLLAVSQYHLSGKFVITVYAVDILKKMIPDEANVYRSMLILDGVTVISTYVGCFLNKILKRRTLLFTTSSVAICFLFALSLYMYLVKSAHISENIYLSIFFLGGFSLSISCGPMIMATSLYAELIPSRYKSLTVIIIAFGFVMLHGTLLKTAPLIFRALKVDGTFLFYGISLSICMILLYFVLPETKDKTLLEIEDYFKEKYSNTTKPKQVAA